MSNDRIDAGFGDVLDRAGKLGAGGSVTPKASTARADWSPASWRQKPALHIPADYPDPAKLAEMAKAAGFATWAELYTNKALTGDVFGTLNFETPVIRAFKPISTSGG